MEQFQHWFLHVDLDAFFASVEQLDHPEYRGKPVIVGGKPEDRRSVVSTASYEARVFGVHSAMPTAQAYKLCPQGIYVHGRMERYAQLSYQIMEILKNYSPDVDQMSIDEAFLDITGTEKLFGTPEEVAYKIKNEIKQNTGLTVSIGLAQSKYHAKIASDMKKPDGFYFVKPETEEEFMLNLPLKKVFGIGTKTLEKLNNCGIKTTRDIHERTIESLQFMCGENQGTFLYNVVRGKFSDDRFGKTAKSHSISAETTFSYDVSDSYTLETVILNLAYSIMFRLLKEKSFSRTAMVKIRYEDFSTVSIQQTFDKNISTLDQFYEILKNLFEKKWEKNRGVRLLGVGLENIETEDKPAQQELFDDGSEKKQKVEKAILNMSQKHPELKVHKARMLQTMNNSFKTLIFIFFVLFGSQKLKAQENQEKPKEDFFKYEIQGFYEAGISGDILSTFGNNTTFAISPSIPVFKQSVDLSADFSFGSNWNFYLNFADNFNKNTYTITYTGDNYLKQFKFSNRNIIFPQYYLSSQTTYNPGGGSNEAPGILFHWENKEASKYKADFILRYDMTSDSQATFYGKNKVSDIKVEPQNYVKGRYFVIPDSAILATIQDIYVETDKNAADNIKINGVSFKKLDSSEYIISVTQKLLILNNNETQLSDKLNARILVTFFDDTSAENLIAAIGTYSDETSYLGKIQKYFSLSQDTIDLSKYTSDLITEIGSQKAIVLQDSRTFSPFAISAGYNLGNTENSDIFVINNISNQKNPSYAANWFLQDFTQIDEDLFKDKNQTVLIYNKSASSTDFTLPENRYPFAEESPYIYLNAQNKTQLAVLKRSYTSVSNFDIGKDAENNSIIVLINGIPTKNFSYASTSGFVTLNQPVSDSDRIDISWKSQAGTADNGTIVSAAGFSYNFNENLFGDITLATKIPFNPFVKYGTYNSNHSSYTALTAGINYSKESFTIKDLASLSFETPNITNCYFVNPIQTTGNQTYYHTQKSIYETKIIPALTDITTPITLIAEKKGKNLISQGEVDSNISGYKLPLKWDFQTLQNWSSMDIKLSQTDQLFNSNKIEIALKNDSEASLEGYRIFIQLGCSAGNDIQNKEQEIPTWEITTLLDLTETSLNKWQTVLLSIPQETQARLSGSKDARLIIYKNTSDINKGKISLGPYELHKNGIQINNSNKLQVSSTITAVNNSPAAKEYLSSKNYADTILWETTELSLQNDETIIQTQNYFSPAYYSDYKKINLDFMFQSFDTKTAIPTTTPALVLILDDFVTEQPALKVELSQNCLKPFIQEDNQFHTISIDTNTKEIFIDGIKIPQTEYTIFMDNTVAPVRQQIKINIQNKDTLISKGKFIIGDLYYTDTNYSLNIKNAFEINYKKDSVLTLKDETPLFYNAFVTASSNQSESIPLSENNSSFFNSDLLIQSGISLLKTDLSGHLLLKFSNINPVDLENAGYSLKSNSSILNFLSYSETFAYNKQNTSIKKDDKIVMDFTKYKVPVNLSFSIVAETSSFKTQQKYDSSLDFSIPIGKTELFSKSTITLSQKTADSTSGTNFPSFGKGWTSALLTQFSPGETSAEQRNEIINTNLNYTITKNIIPQLSFRLDSQTVNSQLQNYTDSAAFNFSVPFKIKNNSFSVSYSKKAVNTQENTGFSSYSKDFDGLFTNQAQMNWFYGSIPFYDLFDQSFTQKLQNTAGISNSYNSKYEIRWKKPLSATIKDLFIPVGASISVARDIVTSSNINDVYQIKGDVNYSFINLLGSKGKLKLFDFFSQDEYSSSISTLIKIPSTGNNITWKVSFAETLLLYIDNKNTIKTSTDFSISGSENWQLKLGGIWTHSGKDSVLVSLPALLFKTVNEMKKEISRKETITIAFGKVNNLFQQEYKYLHSCDVKLDEKITINNTLGAAFNYTQEKAASLNLEYSLGAKIEF